MNKNQTMGKIRVKNREKEEDEDLIFDRIRICQIETSNRIYEIYTYFIDRTTNTCNNLEYNNIIFLFRVPSSYGLNLFGRRIIVMLIKPIFC